jgi:hypothetical protein
MKTGVIGLRLGNSKENENRKSQKPSIRIPPQVKVREKDGILFIFTNEDKTDDPPAAVWKKVTRAHEKSIEIILAHTDKKQTPERPGV